MISWLSRPDLQKGDIGSRQGRRQLIRQLRKEAAGAGISSRILRRVSRAFQTAQAGSPAHLRPGVNLIGYADGVLGMGEHIRMAEKAMRASDIPAGVLNVTLGLGPRRQAADRLLPRLKRPDHRCNLFHVNADQMPRAYWHFGPESFAGHYNIGYWAWELSRWPDVWLPALGTVDEIWAPSRFIRDAIAPRTSKPVEWMPLCVELPPVQDASRSDFGISGDEYVFVFAFDCHSYIDRKNPRGLVRAFRSAFANETGVRLIIKAMNTDVCLAEWQEILAETDSDERITLIDGTWPRDRLLALVQCSDAYVSLHRSEGFGRGPAEAMLLGKPVIVTDYSGTTDFCRPNNALLVDCSLVQVNPQSYVAAAGQVWGEPSIEQAARHMRSLFEDRELGPRIGAMGQQTISQEFSAVAVGGRYRARLDEAGMI